MLAKITSAACLVALAAFNVGAIAFQFATIPLAKEERKHLQLIADLAQVEKLMVDAETGQRGYAITGGTDFLEPYNQAKSLIPQYLPRIKELPQSPKINELVAAKLSRTSSVVQLNASQAQRAIATRKGKVIMDNLRGVIADATKEEQGKLAIAQSRHRLAKDSATLLLAGAICSDVGAVIFVRWRAKDVREQAKELRRAVDEKTRELVAANHQLREAYHLKSQFLSTVSHEYRNPLAKIQLVADLLRVHSDAPKEKQRRWIDQIEASVERMTALLEKVLTLENQPPCHRSLLNLEDVLAEVIDEQPSIFRVTESPPTWDRVRYLSHAHDLTGQFDKGSLKEIFGNLINNALKYSDDVVVVRLMQIAQSAIVEVRDRGIGIPEKDIPRLFTDFSRGSNTGVIQGTGLGLAIVYRALQRCGGSITVSSKEGEGSTFRVELPLE